MLPIVKYHSACFLLLAAFVLLADSAHAVDLNCTGPQMGEIFIDTKTGSVTKSAEETHIVEIVAENSHYRFHYKGEISQFKASINRESGQIIMDEACLPKCWSGPIFGVCTIVKAKL